MPEQITDLLEGRAALGVGKVVDVVALIGEHAAGAIQVTDGGFTDDDVFETGFDCLLRHDPGGRRSICRKLRRY